MLVKDFVIEKETKGRPEKISTKDYVTAILLHRIVRSFSKGYAKV